MSLLAPQLIRGIHAPPLQSSAVGYWSPDALGWNAIELPPGGFVQTPFLDARGFNSFMLIYTMVDPGVGQIQITLEDPRNTTSFGLDVFTESPGGMLSGAPGAAVTFGAFSTDFIDGPYLSTAAVWWVFSLAAEGDNGENFTGWLFGARR